MTSAVRRPQDPLLLHLAGQLKPLDLVVLGDLEPGVVDLEVADLEPEVEVVVELEVVDLEPKVRELEVLGLVPVVLADLVLEREPEVLVDLEPELAVTGLEP